MKEFQWARRVGANTGSPTTQQVLTAPKDMTIVVMSVTVSLINGGSGTVRLQAESIQSPQQTPNTIILWEGNVSGTHHMNSMQVELPVDYDLKWEQSTATWSGTVLVTGYYGTGQQDARTLNESARTVT